MPAASSTGLSRLWNPLSTSRPEADSFQRLTTRTQESSYSRTTESCTDTKVSVIILAIVHAARLDPEGNQTLGSDLNRNPQLRPRRSMAMSAVRRSYFCEQTLVARDKRAEPHGRQL